MLPLLPLLDSKRKRTKEKTVLPSQPRLARTDGAYSPRCIDLERHGLAPVT
jgi:hypothetical protein